MKTKSYLKQFLKYTWFNVLGMLGLSCYILVDTFFISKGLGADGLTALNLALPIYSLINGCGLMLGMGGATRYAILKGQGKREEGNQVYTCTIYLAIGFFVVYFIGGMVIDSQLATLLGASGIIFPMTKIYLKVIMLFSPAFIINDVLQCFVRNDGDPRLSMFAMLGGSISNIILDYIFIFPMHLGIFGAVLATGGAPLFSMILLSRHFRKNKNEFHFQKRMPKVKWTVKIIPLGVPALVTELSSGIVMLVFNMIILGLSGNVGVAAYGIIANLSLVVLSIYTGIAQGMQPLTSDCYGKGEANSTLIILKYGVIMLCILSVVIYVGMFLFADPIAKIFNSGNNEMLQLLAVPGIRYYFFGIIFAGFNIVMAAFLGSVDQAIPAQFIAILRGFVLIIPLAFLMARVAGIIGIWLTFPVAEVIVFVIAIVIYFRKMSRLSQC